MISRKACIKNSFYFIFMMDPGKIKNEVLKFENEEEDVFLDQDKVRMKNMLRHNRSVSEFCRSNIAIVQ